MKTLLAILFATFLAATSHGQTVKALSYNVTNSAVIWTNTNALTFLDAIQIDGNGTIKIDGTSMYWEGAEFFDFETMEFYDHATSELAFRIGYDINSQDPSSFNTTYTALAFGGTNAALHAAQTRTNLGLGATNSVTFESVIADVFLVSSQIDFDSPSVAAATRTNLGIGATDTPAFRGLTSDGNIVISNQTATNNGLLFVYRTNSEPFLGLANLLASNNTTISNETLFRVGVAEATNRSAQFGFRSTNTNGNGVAVFSVFGFDALMMIGADASTNAVIYSGGGANNEVMTLIRDGATEFARPIRFSTNASTRPETNAPANTTNVAAWVEMRIGTNSYRVPLYQ
jgi:hypothetical protein